MAGGGANAALELECPDGGYGWVVVIAFSMCSGIVFLKEEDSENESLEREALPAHVFISQTLFMFMLVFKDTFRKLNISATDVATITNLNFSFSMLLGIVTSVLQKRFGNRSVACVGAILSSIGLLCTAYSESFFQFLVSYSVIASAGMGLAVPAFTVALHSYFRRRRRTATSIAVSISGLANILLPQLVSLLLWEYGPRGTCFLLAGLALQALVAAALLQPVSWHRPRHARPAARPTNGDLVAPSICAEEFPKDPEAERMLDGAFDLPALAVLEEETNSDLEREFSDRRRASTASSYHTARMSFWASVSVLDLRCSAFALDQTVPEEEEDDQEEQEQVAVLSEAPPRPPGWLARCRRRLYRALDLGLLTNPCTAYLMLGVALAFFADVNFAQFVPLILAERGFDTPAIATFMSSMSFAEVLSKLASTFLLSRCRISSKFLYASMLVCLVAARFALLLVRSYWGIMVVMLCQGFCKGLRSVLYYLILPDNVPQHRLASALGLQAVINGIVFLALGPLIGYIRDSTGSYDLVIITCNIFSVTTACMWSVEHIYIMVKRRQSKQHR